MTDWDRFANPHPGVTSRATGNWFGVVIIRDGKGETISRHRTFKAALNAAVKFAPDSPYPYEVNINQNFKTRGGFTIKPVAKLVVS